MLQRILCSWWLKWALMGLGGVGGFMISRKKTKKAIVKVGATGGGVAVGYVAWRFLVTKCLPGGMEIGPDEGYLPMEGPDDYGQGYSKTPPIPTKTPPSPYERPPGSGTKVPRPSKSSSVTIDQNGNIIQPGGASTMGPAPNPAMNTKSPMASSRTKTSGMFGGAYGN